MLILAHWPHTVPSVADRLVLHKPHIHPQLPEPGGTSNLREAALSNQTLLLIWTLKKKTNPNPQVILRTNRIRICWEGWNQAPSLKKMSQVIPTAACESATSVLATVQVRCIRQQRLGAGGNRPVSGPSPDLPVRIFTSTRSPGDACAQAVCKTLL